MMDLSDMRLDVQVEAYRLPVTKQRLAEIRAVERAYEALAADGDLYSALAEGLESR